MFVKKIMKQSILAYLKWSKVGDFKSDGWSCKMAVNSCNPVIDGGWRW
jgi:hypothetical protein